MRQLRKTTKCNFGQTQPKIAIWAVADIYGGVQVLTSRFASYLSENNIDFTIISRKGTRIAEEIMWAKQIEYAELHNCHEKFTHIFFPHVAALKEDLPWEAIRDTYVCCWLVHPTEIFTAFYPRTDRLLLWFGCGFAKWIQIFYGNHTRRIRYLLQKLIEKDALFVMDGATQRGLDYFYPSLRGQCNMIPIPAEVQENLGDVVKRNISQNSLSIGYLGRLDEFKLSALIPFISHSLASLTKKWDIELHLVSEGSGVDYVRKICRENGIVVHEYGFLPNSMAKQLIAEKTDLAVCMGTAALDIASISHPCIIIDPAHNRKTRPQEKFSFVHEISEFTLGEFRDCRHYREGKHTIEAIVNQVKNDPLLGVKGLNYVRDYHATEIVFKHLLEQLSASKLRGQEIESCVFDFRESYLKKLNVLSLALKVIGK